MLDYIIVGKGLAGSTISLELLKLKKKIKVIDNNNKFSSSVVASGLVHPMSFKRTILSWNAELLCNYSYNYYKNKEKEFGCNFLEDLTFLRLFSSIEEQNNWFSKKDIHPYNNILSSFENKLDNYGINNNFGIGELNLSYRLDINKYLELINKKLNSLGVLEYGLFDYDCLEILEKNIVYKGLEAKNIIFCEGHLYTNNPYFNFIPDNLTKGEILIINTDKLPPYTISKGCFLLPIKNNNYILGATYNWSERDYETTQKAKNELLDKFKKISNCEVKVVTQKAGIRPTTRDRKPILGTHPIYKNLHIFNGLGSKGVMLAPYYAKIMLDFINSDNLKLEKEIDVNRFFK